MGVEWQGMRGLVEEGSANGYKGTEYAQNVQTKPTVPNSTRMPFLPHRTQRFGNGEKRVSNYVGREGRRYATGDNPIQNAQTFVRRANK